MAKLLVRLKEKEAAGHGSEPNADAETASVEATSGKPSQPTNADKVAVLAAAAEAQLKEKEAAARKRKAVSLFFYAGRQEYCQEAQQPLIIYVYLCRNPPRHAGRLLKGRPQKRRQRKSPWRMKGSKPRSSQRRSRRMRRCRKQRGNVSAG